MSKPKHDKNINIPDNFLRQLLTTTEIRMLKNRFQIMNLLEEGLSIRKIAEKVKVGTDTVVRVVRMVERNNLKRSVSLKRSRSPVKIGPTSWIFGKANE